MIHELKILFSILIVFFMDYKNKKDSKANTSVYVYDLQYRVLNKNHTLKIHFLIFMVSYNGVQKQEPEYKGP